MSHVSVMSLKSNSLILTDDENDLDHNNKVNISSSHKKTASIKGLDMINEEEEVEDIINDNETFDQVNNPNSNNDVHQENNKANSIRLDKRVSNLLAADINKVEKEEKVNEISYNVIKLNQFNRKQDRIIILTNDEFILKDKKSGNLRKKYSLDLFEEIHISTANNSYVTLLKFNQQATKQRPFQVFFENDSQRLDFTQQLVSRQSLIKITYEGQLNDKVDCYHFTILKNIYLVLNNVLLLYILIY